MNTKLRVALAFAIAVAAPVWAADKVEPLTPPSEMDAPGLEADMAKVDQQWAPTFEALKNEEYFNLKNTEVSQWSCGQQAGHIGLILGMMFGAIEANLANPDQNVDGTINEMGKQVMAAGDFPRGVAQAPEGGRPENMSREDLIETLEKAQERWKKIAEQADALASSKSRSPHPAFGQLTAADWVRFSGIHTAHHLALVRDILKASGKTGDAYGKALLVEVES
jgi:hypothetical protein